MRPVTDLQRSVAPFQVVTDMVPAGDQPAAIAQMDRRIQGGDKDTVLLGATVIARRDARGPQPAARTCCLRTTDSENNPGVFW